MRKSALLFMTLAVVMIIVGALFVYKSYSNDTGSASLKIEGGTLTNVSAAYLTFETVSIYSSSGKWSNYSIGNTTVNILGRTASNATQLATLVLRAQSYTMFTFLLKNVTIVYQGKPLSMKLTSSLASAKYLLNITSGNSYTVVVKFALNSDINLGTHQFTPNIQDVIS
jgi:hypothetical protein